MDVILSGLGLLHEPDEIIEIRSIDPKPVISGYFRADSPAIAKELSRYPNRTFYQTMKAAEAVAAIWKKEKAKQCRKKRAQQRETHNSTTTWVLAWPKPVVSIKTGHGGNE